MSIRKALESLISEGVVEETVHVAEKSWTMKTLQSGEHLDATSSTAQYDTLSRIYALKMEILARAIKSVEGIKLDKIEESLDFIRQLQPVIVNKLYDEYEKLQTKQNEAFESVEEIKN